MAGYVGGFNAPPTTKDNAGRVSHTGRFRIVVRSGRIKDKLANRVFRYSILTEHMVTAVWPPTRDRRSWRFVGLNLFGRPPEGQLQSGRGHCSVGATQIPRSGGLGRENPSIAVWVPAFLTFSNSLRDSTIGIGIAFKVANFQEIDKTTVASKFGHTTYADIYMGEWSDQTKALCARA
jgi:hypothetical protein